MKYSTEQEELYAGFTKPKILMVDDRPENLIALERLLKDMHVELFKANSGNEALKLTLHNDFALALLDIQMPDMDGYELAEILRQEDRTSNMPFIFISAIHTDHINIFQGYEKGAFSYITKPFEPKVLINKVRFFVDRYIQDQIMLKQTDELKYINQELESFSYSVSHDLRAPLRAIDGFTALLKESLEGKLDEEEHRYFGLINMAVNKMGRLIDDLLEYSRMGRMDKRETTFEMKSLFESVFAEMTQLDKKCEFVLKDLPEVKADLNMMRQVVQNLLGNAIKYSSAKEKPVIEVGTIDDETEHIFYVKDNGAGFEMDYVHKIFGMFQRLHSEKEFEGTGVGLAIVQRIIHKHDGRVWAEGVPGKGATFFFSLPKTL